MGWKGLEREKLDYVLTDVLPVEVSELFSFSQFYHFLLRKENQKTIKEIATECKENKAQNKKLSEKGWATKPLKYMILKDSNSLRKMSIIQPFSALNLYFFIECYQKDIIHYFEKNHTFSIRYHKNATNLYYKSRKKNTFHYFQSQSTRMGRGIIQQAGNFFKITPFESLNAFTDSRYWRRCNFKYKFYAKLDYKACFDSIYTHAFTWIVERNTVDAKNASNSNLFIVIDRILQNINGRFSNGIVVGPEFSRMMAEILLQHIDKEVLYSLEKENIKYDVHYIAFRYVDDIFIFANQPSTIDTILEKYKLIAEKFLLRLNDLKLEQGTTPCLPKEWLEKTRQMSDTINNFFYKEGDHTYISLSDENKYLVKNDFIHIDRIKDEVAVLIKKYSESRRFIVSFLLSTLLNNISKKRKGLILFGEKGSSRALVILDIAFYIYAFFPSFEQTRKLISILSYINTELNFKEDSINKNKLHKIFNYYSFIFTSGNIFDLCDWLPFLSEYRIKLTPKIEQILIDKSIESDNPIILATLLIYSQYSKRFFREMMAAIEDIILKRISKISSQEEMMRDEFWYVLIFHNCPHIGTECRNKINNIIGSLKKSNAKHPSEKICNLLCTFLEVKDSTGNKLKNSFFNWNGSNHFADQITYRTYQRTLFKKYHKNPYMFASIT